MHWEPSQEISWKCEPLRSSFEPSLLWRIPCFQGILRTRITSAHFASKGEAVCPGVDPGFWSGGSAEFCPGRGGLWAQNVLKIGGFPFILLARGAWALRPPWICWWCLCFLCSATQIQDFCWTIGVLEVWPWGRGSLIHPFPFGCFFLKSAGFNLGTLSPQGLLLFHKGNNVNSASKCYLWILLCKYRPSCLRQSK